jgi:hypothetical protein
MQPIAKYENISAIGARTKLPAGGYVCEIIGANEVNTNWGSRLEIGIEITEGDYQGHFGRDFAAQNRDAKWKGIMRLSIPREDGDDKYEFFVGLFKAAMEAVEESNTGYQWDWNEKNLKGKKVGVIFQEREWEYNGKTGFSTQCYRFTPVEKIRNGDFDVPKPKLLEKEIEPTEPAFPDTYDQSLPF